jgi:hypothetical protein
MAKQPIMFVNLQGMSKRERKAAARKIAREILGEVKVRDKEGQVTRAEERSD